MTHDKQVRSVANGLTRMMILWILSKESNSGYSIMKEVKEITGLKYHAGVLYPMLYNLEDEGLISGNWEHKGHRNIKHYMITDKGNATLKKLRRFIDSRLRDMFVDI